MKKFFSGVFAWIGALIAFVILVYFLGHPTTFLAVFLIPLALQLVKDIKIKPVHTWVFILTLVFIWIGFIGPRIDKEMWIHMPPLRWVISHDRLAFTQWFAVKTYTNPNLAQETAVFGYVAGRDTILAAYEQNILKPLKVKPILSDNDFDSLEYVQELIKENKSIAQGLLDGTAIRPSAQAELQKLKEHYAAIFQRKANKIFDDSMQSLSKANPSSLPKLLDVKKAIKGMAVAESISNLLIGQQPKASAPAPAEVTSARQSQPGERKEFIDTVWVDTRTPGWTKTIHIPAGSKVKFYIPPEYGNLEFSWDPKLPKATVARGGGYTPASGVQHPDEFLDANLPIVSPVGKIEGNETFGLGVSTEMYVEKGGYFYVGFNDRQCPDCYKDNQEVKVPVVIEVHVLS